MLKITHTIGLLVFMVFHCFASQKIVLNSKSATALNTVTLYPDSTFAKHSSISYEEGALFELIEESIEMHEDDAQNQKFKWYKVKANNEKIGWIFGDGLAVIIPDFEVESSLKKFHKEKIDLGSGFKNALMWIASVEGRDNFHTQDYLNPVYSEQYLVITNQMGRSVHINIAGVNARGKNELSNLDFVDLTGDDKSEILLQTTSHSVGSNLSNKNLEIYGMQGGTLAKLLEEHLTLAYEDDIQSPAISKKVELQNNVVRVEYIDYLNCENYQQGFSTQAISKTMERCMEYVTYTYMWNARKKVFEQLYEETRTSLVGTTKLPTSLKEHPSYASKNLFFLQPNESLTIIKHFEKAVLQGHTKKVDYYLLVKTQSGKTGYILASEVAVRNCSHATILNQFYTQAPLDKNRWSSNQESLFVNSDQMVTRK